MKSIIYNGYYFPADGREKDYQFSTKRVRSLEYILKYWPKDKRRCVVQAGGSYGVWPAMLAKSFQLVYTFEPDWISFYYLNLNCPFENVYKIQAALSNCNKTVKLKRSSFTTHRISDIGYIPGITLDCLKLLKCDMILLDVEGFELHVLSGAKNTIQEFHPLILLEWRENIFAFHQTDPSKIEELLSEWDYELVVEIDSDRIYKHKDMKWNPPVKKKK